MIKIKRARFIFRAVCGCCFWVEKAIPTFRFIGNSLWSYFKFIESKPPPTKKRRLPKNHPGQSGLIFPKSFHHKRVFLRSHSHRSVLNWSGFIIPIPQNGSNKLYTIGSDRKNRRMINCNTSHAANLAGAFGPSFFIPLMDPDNLPASRPSSFIIRLRAATPLPKARSSGHGDDDGGFFNFNQSKSRDCSSFCEASSSIIGRRLLTRKTDANLWISDDGGGGVRLDVRRKGES